MVAVRRTSRTRSPTGANLAIVRRRPNIGHAIARHAAFTSPLRPFVERSLPLDGWSANVVRRHERPPASIVEIRHAAREIGTPMVWRERSPALLAPHGGGSSSSSGDGAVIHGYLATPLALSGGAIVSTLTRGTLRPASSRAPAGHSRVHDRRRPRHRRFRPVARGVPARPWPRPGRHSSDDRPGRGVSRVSRERGAAARADDDAGRRATQARDAIRTRGCSPHGR